MLLKCIVGSKIKQISAAWTGIQDAVGHP